MPNGTTVVMIESKTTWVLRKESDKINLHQLPMKIDSDQSGRTLNLKMVRDYLGTKVKIEMEWSYITLEVSR